MLRRGRGKETEAMYPGDVMSIAPTNNGSSVCGSTHGRSLHAATDADLVRRCGQRDQAALEELTQRFQAPLFRFLLRLMGSPEDAEEAALEVFVRVWLYAGKFRHQSSVSTWLYRIAANIARDAHAHRRARPETAPAHAYDLAKYAAGDAEAEALAHLESEERSRILAQALAMLNSTDRLVLVLYYLEGRDYAEMQAITGWVYPVLKTRLVRARIRLRGRLKELGFEAMP